MITYLALHFWRGELRAQRLISRNRTLMIVQLIFALVVLAALASGVRHLLLRGLVPISNVALLGILGMALIFSNVLVTGEESGTRTDDLRAWALPRPLTARTLRGFVIATGFLRSALFTVTLIGAVTAGALSAASDWTARGEVVAAGVLLPLPPVTAALWFSTGRARRLGPGFVTVPLGLAFLVTAVRLPTPRGAWAAVAQVLAAPGLTLLGRARPAIALTVLIAWVLAVAFLLSRLRVALQRAPAVAGPTRPPRAARLGRVRPSGVILDVVTHRVRPGWEAGQLGVLAGFLSAVGVLVIAAGAGPQGSAPRSALTVVTAAALAIPAAVAGYRQLLDATALRMADREWLRQVPLPAFRVHLTRHLVCVAGAMASCAVLAVALGGYLGLAHPAAAGPRAVPVLAVLLAPVSLTGWLAVALTWYGLARIAGYLLMTGYALIRGIAVAVIVTAALPGTAVAAFVLSDLAVGLGGHLAAGLALRRTPL